MKCPETLAVTQMLFTIFATVYCLLSFPITMLCTPLASCSNLQRIWGASKASCADFYPEIRQVKSCFQPNVFIGCSVENFRGVYKAHFHNKVTEKLPVFFRWSADRILSTMLHTSVYSTNVFLVGSYWWRTHEPIPGAKNIWTIL